MSTTQTARHELRAADLPQALRKSLRDVSSSRKRTAIVATEVEIPIDAGLWEGGSREVYFLARIADGAITRDPQTNRAPSNSVRRERKVTLQPGFVVVRHATMQGHDCGLTLYVHPVDVAKILPAGAIVPAIASGLERYHVTVSHHTGGSIAEVRDREQPDECLGIFTSAGKHADTWQADADALAAHLNAAK